MPNIFVTGGAGFLGRAILREARANHPDRIFTIYSRDEAKQAPVRAEFPEYRFILGDVRDLDQLTLAMTGHDAVIHAAALKYVPQAETNVGQTVEVNVTGSRNVAMAAMRARVEQVVGISTDKACRAINVYGLTKRLMERLFQEADTLTDTRFHCVRYGNVVGSTGSVIPMFMQQAREGRITLTNPAMTRFWLDADRAVGLINIALADTDGGCILIPRLPATDMETVAKACAVAAGVDKPKYETIGHRFGEKINEDLLAPEELPDTWYAAGRLMYLYAPGVGRQVAPVGAPYTSATPDHWIGVDEMAQMIEKAPS